MTDSPVNAKLTLEEPAGQIAFARIETRDHLEIIMRLDFSLEDFAKFIGGQEVLAAITLPGTK